MALVAACRAWRSWPRRCACGSPCGRAGGGGAEQPRDGAPRNRREVRRFPAGSAWWPLVDVRLGLGAPCADHRGARESAAVRGRRSSPPSSGRAATRASCAAFTVEDVFGLTAMGVSLSRTRHPCASRPRRGRRGLPTLAVGFGPRRGVSRTQAGRRPRATSSRLRQYGPGDPMRHILWKNVTRATRRLARAHAPRRAISRRTRRPWRFTVAGRGRTSPRCAGGAPVPRGARCSGATSSSAPTAATEPGARTTHHRDSSRSSTSAAVRRQRRRGPGASVPRAWTARAPSRRAWYFAPPPSTAAWRESAWSPFATRLPAPPHRDHSASTASTRPGAARSRAACSCAGPARDQRRLAPPLVGAARAARPPLEEARATRAGPSTAPTGQGPVTAAVRQELPRLAAARDRKGAGHRGGCVPVSSIRSPTPTGVAAGGHRRGDRLPASARLAHWGAGCASRAGLVIRPRCSALIAWFGGQFLLDHSALRRSSGRAEHLRHRVSAAWGRARGRVSPSARLSQALARVFAVLELANCRRRGSRRTFAAHRHQPHQRSRAFLTDWAWSHGIDPFLVLEGCGNRGDRVFAAITLLDARPLVEAARLARVSSSPRAPHRVRALLKDHQIPAAARPERHPARQATRATSRRGAGAAARAATAASSPTPSP